jgi:hypothetical protein
VIILGDNPFFGVNHASATQATGYYARLKVRDWSAAHATMRAGLAHGVDHFMVSTHAEAPDLLASMQADPELRTFRIIPAVPYLHRLNGVVATKGVPAAMLASMDYARAARSLLATGSAPAAALAGFVAREVEEVASLGFAVPAIALQNIFVDLLLGLGQAAHLNRLADDLARAGRRLIAITMNPILADRLLAPAIILCTHYNVLGYMVQPDLASFRRWLGETRREVWAMGVMASGKAKLADVVADPALDRFGSLLIGASRPASIQAFVEGVRQGREGARVHAAQH